MRNKVPKEEKRKSISITIDEDILDIFNNYVEKNNIKNKSKFIEKLLYNELNKKND